MLASGFMLATVEVGWVVVADVDDDLVVVVVVMQ